MTDAAHLIHPPEIPALVEDLVTVLFDPRSGAIAGENTLFYVLGGAVLADLALQEQVELSDRGRWKGEWVTAVGGHVPVDPILREVWQRVSGGPQEVQSLLAEVGPPLRATVLNRLVARGTLRRRERKLLGLIPSPILTLGTTGRRELLIDRLVPVLTEGAEPRDERTAALAALLSASGSLPALHADIGWSGLVYTRGKELEAGAWGAAAAGTAVTRTLQAVITSAALVVAAVRPPG